jgi:hypothetical protein
VSLYENARRVLGDIPADSSTPPGAPPSSNQAQAKDSGEGFDLLMRQLVGNINMPMLQTPQTPTSSFQNFLNTFGGFIR